MRFATFTPGTEVRMLGPSPLARHYVDRPPSPAAVSCTAPRATGDARPSCIMCWLATETKLAQLEPHRLADDGGPCHADD